MKDTKFHTSLFAWDDKKGAVLEVVNEDSNVLAMVQNVVLSETDEGMKIQVTEVCGWSMVDKGRHGQLVTRGRYGLKVCNGHLRSGRECNRV